MDAQKAAQELATIRDLMERPVQLSVMSGAAGVFAAAVALAGLIADGVIWRSMPARQATVVEVLLWGGVFVAALAGALLLTRRRERKMDLPFWSAARKRELRAAGAPFCVGVALTLAIIAQWFLHGSQMWSLWGLIPPIWMACYGLACWQVSEFGPGELRVMAVAFMASAVAAVFFPGYPYLILGVTFGGYHLVYGVVVWIRHGG